jgi:hypothetical protein
MNRSLLRTLGLLLVLSVGGWSAHAQRGFPSFEPPSAEGGCWCSAEGAECLFGYANGCTVVCHDALCDCVGASCFLGFPRASRCRCRFA